MTDRSAGGAVVFDLVIGASAWLDYYRGSARTIRVRAEDGRTVAFPARVLRAFVGRHGVRGRFRLEFDQDGRFRRIELMTQGTRR